jgi:hypothetical protein
VFDGWNDIFRDETMHMQEYDDDEEKCEQYFNDNDLLGYYNDASGECIFRVCTSCVLVKRSEWANGQYYVMLGDGEPNHGDLDGDGYAGEDWFNGRDDDGDGLVDEDYWFADGIDNAEPYTDLNNNGTFDFDCLNGNGVHDGPEPFFDLNGNGTWDEGEWWQDLQGGVDLNGNGVIDNEAHSPQRYLHYQ